MDKLIISISHSNYLIKSSGTEKNMREIYSLLLKEKVHCLNLFSFHNKWINNNNKSLVGVNLDKDFIGIFSYEKVIDLIHYIIRKKSFKLVGVHLQHLQNHNLENLSKVLKEIKLPITLFLHDFHTVCSRVNLLNQNNIFCGVTKPNRKKCEKCNFKDVGIEHFKKIESFLTSVKDLLQFIIAPSTFVKDSWSSVYPNFAGLIHVRPHLLLSGEYKRPLINGNKLKLAFVGGQYPLKGYSEWKAMVEYITKNNIENFDLYYFGTGKEYHNNVTNIYVSIAEQGEQAMVEKLKEYSIDCAFLWSLCPETYSYVYFELSVSGVFVITNNGTGNIYEMVKQNKNGIIFNSLTDCIETISNVNFLIDCINRYRKESFFIPAMFESNSCKKGLFVDDVKSEVLVTKKECYFNLVATFLYLLKNRKVRLRKI